MKEEQSSKSAVGVALFRALEALRPETDRICSDPYAHVFLSNFMVSFCKFINFNALYELIAPGATSFIFVRERYIDDVLKAMLKEGLEQVVILGAGFDTRPYRIPGIEKARVFEIDQAAPQAVKLKGVKKIVDPPPANVTFVPVDFNTQTLADRLQGIGYSETARTLFIWQGVTYFLTAEGVDSTLAFIASHSGLGSAVIFDYFYNETLMDPNNQQAKAMRQAGKAAGEEYLFGIDQGKVEDFLVQRGFKNVQDKTLEDLKRIYFTGVNANRKVPPGMSIVLAEVNPPRS